VARAREWSQANGLSGYRLRQCLDRAGRLVLFGIVAAWLACRTDARAGRARHGRHADGAAVAAPQPRRRPRPARRRRPPHTPPRIRRGRAVPASSACRGQLQTGCELTVARRLATGGPHTPRTDKDQSGSAPSRHRRGRHTQRAVAESAALSPSRLLTRTPTGQRRRAIPQRPHTPVAVVGSGHGATSGLGFASPCVRAADAGAYPARGRRGGGGGPCGRRRAALGGMPPRAAAPRGAASGHCADMVYPPCLLRAATARGRSEAAAARRAAGRTPPPEGGVGHASRGAWRFPPPPPPSPFTNRLIRGAAGAAAVATAPPRRPRGGGAAAPDHGGGAGDPCGSGRAAAAGAVDRRAAGRHARRVVAARAPRASERGARPDAVAMVAGRGGTDGAGEGARRHR